jgi:hypothetical protein
VAAGQPITVGSWTSQHLGSIDLGFSHIPVWYMLRIPPVLGNWLSGTIMKKDDRLPICLPRFLSLRQVEKRA